jgi:protein-disulfide isomerase
MFDKLILETTTCLTAMEAGLGIRKDRRTVASLWSMACVVFVACGWTSRLPAQDAEQIPRNAQIALLREAGTPSLGAKKPDVTVVEYFDYNCPFCKKLDPALQGLLRSDAKVALVYKDWPILSKVSLYAAQSALAAGWQGKYVVAHDALMHASHLASNEQVDSLLRVAGVEMKTLQSDREAHAAQINALLVRNDTESRALGMRGTPGLIIGRRIVNGIYDVPGLQQVVASARRDP